MPGFFLGLKLRLNQRTLRNKNKYTNVEIPKFRYFNPKMETPVMENDPDRISLSGEEDPFPLDPEVNQEIEEQKK